MRQMGRKMEEFGRLSGSSGINLAVSYKGLQAPTLLITIIITVL